MKKSLLVYSSIQVACIRIVAAFLFFVPIIARQWKNIAAEKWRYLALSGFLGVFFPAFLFTIAGKHMPSAISGALNALTPLFTLIIGALFFGRNIKSLQIVGIVLGITGSMFLIFSGKIEQLSINAYAFLVMMATIMYGFNLNIVKKYLNDMPALLVTAGLVSVIGPIAALILLTTDFWQASQQAGAGIALVYALILGIVGTAMATILFNRLLQLTHPVFASSVTYLIPIFAFLWGFADGESIGVQHLLGMAIILIGVYLVNKS